MLQYAQSTSLIMTLVFLIQKGKDDSSYQVCVGGRVRRLLCAASAPVSSSNKCSDAPPAAVTTSAKSVFKIYDPVDIYAALQDVSTMKPLVKDPNVTLEQLLQELNDPNSLTAPGSKDDTSHAHDVRDAISQKVMRILRKAVKSAEKKPQLKQKLAELETLWGVEPSKLHTHLHQLSPEQAADFVLNHSGLLKQLGEVNALLGSDRLPIIYEGKGEFKSRSQTYGVNEKPADYLDSFNHFIRNQLNQSVALGVIVNQPKDLTREQLREVRLLLDEHGYSEAKLQSAWRNQTHQEIAASIVGYIRQAAFGEALLPFEQRVNLAMQKTLCT